MNKYRVLAISIIFLSFITSCSMDTGGVKLNNNMEKYALEYIKNNNLLNEGEVISAYYDYTISLDGSEAVLLTNERLLYHNKETSDTSILLKDITDIQHREESLIGDIIEVYSENGDIFVIEVAPLNDGKLFLNALTSKTTALN